MEIETIVSSSKLHLNDNRILKSFDPEVTKGGSVTVRELLFYSCIDISAALEIIHSGVADFCDDFVSISSKLTEYIPRKLVR